MSRLQVLAPESLQSQNWNLQPGAVILGRGPEANWRFPEPSVSRRHAVIRSLGDHDEIEDLESTAGTLVNGRPLHSPRTLRPGDLIQLATITLRYEGTVRDTGGATGQPPSAVSFDVSAQQAHTISNVARDQYNQYVQQVIVQREDALRQVVTMNRFARILVTVGFGLAFAGILSFIGTGVVEMARGANVDMSSPEAFRASTQPIELGGIPVFALAMGVALVGFALVAIGVLVQMSAKRQTQRVDRDYPLPPMPPV